MSGRAWRLAVVAWSIAWVADTALHASASSGSAAPAAETAGAQAPAPAEKQPASLEEPKAPPQQPDVSQAAYTYESGGRRDPFVDLIGSGIEAQQTSTKRGEGSAALTVAEVSVRGVLQGRGGMLAMVQGPDQKTYLVRAGDKFADGTIKNITPQGLVILQEVNDPLSLVKQREIQKLLRSLEGGKQ